MSKTIEMNTKALDNLIRALGNQIPHARVGILGGKTSRKDGELNNATIGLKHEFGDDDLPVRSFLRQPITEHLQDFLDKNGIFDMDALKLIIKTSSFEEFIAKVGITAEEVVAEAFATGGFGKWKPSNMDFKKNHQTLVETQQLRNSITSEVVK